MATESHPAAGRAGGRVRTGDRWLGRYVPGASPVHELDPRTKVLALAAVSTAVFSLPAEAAAVWSSWSRPPSAWRGAARRTWPAAFAGTSGCSPSAPCCSCSGHRHPGLRGPAGGDRPDGDARGDPLRGDGLPALRRGHRRGGPRLGDHLPGEAGLRAREDARPLARVGLPTGDAAMAFSVCLQFLPLPGPEAPPTSGRPRSPGDRPPGRRPAARLERRGRCWCRSWRVRCGAPNRAGAGHAARRVPPRRGEDLPAPPASGAGTCWPRRRLTAALLRQPWPATSRWSS